MKRAFTVIELLVVILVIMILAGITVVTMRSARVLFTGVTAKNELSILDAALEQYKSKYGEYPPDNLDPAAVKRHILKRWPEVLKTGNVNALVDLICFDSSTTPSTLICEPEKALLFWLCGPDRGNGQRQFSLDPKDPFKCDFTAATPAFSPLTDSSGRLIEGETTFIELSYIKDDGTGPGNCDGNSFVFRGAPIVYFRAEKLGYIYPDPSGAIPTLIKEQENFTNDKVEGCATPYMQNGKWINPDSYQLIMAGSDGNFGLPCPNGGSTPIARDIGKSETLADNRADYDNITNFTSGAFLDSIISGN